MKRASDSSSALLLLARSGPGPWQELVEAIVGPEINQAGKAIGEPGLGIDIAQFSGLDERRENGPIFGAVIVTREEGILARQSHHRFILPMSGRSWKSVTGITLISVGRFWCVAWSVERRACSLWCRGPLASLYQSPVGCSIL